MSGEITAYACRGGEDCPMRKKIPGTNYKGLLYLDEEEGKYECNVGSYSEEQQFSSDCEKLRRLNALIEEQRQQRKNLVSSVFGEQPENVIEIEEIVFGPIEYI